MTMMIKLPAQIETSGQWLLSFYASAFLAQLTSQKSTNGSRAYAAYAQHLKVCCFVSSCVRNDHLD